jgi:hypothetical protein
VPKIRRSPVEDDEPLVDLAPHWWRITLIATAAAVAAFLSDSALLGAFAMLPLVLWCGGLGRSPRTGAMTGLALLTLMVWFTAPRGLGWSSHWVPSADEVLWLHPTLATIVSSTGMLIEQRKLVGINWLLTVLLAGFALRTPNKVANWVVGGSR